MNLLQANTPVVRCLFGTPTSQLLEWLEKEHHHYLILLEEHLTDYLQMRSLFTHSKIKTVLISNDYEEIWRAIAWEYLFASFIYEHTSEKQILFNALKKVQEEVHLSASDFRERGLDILKNLKRNLPFLERAKRGRELFGHFRNIPAIICGGGPSLDANIEVLKQVGDRALIFAGGSALKALNYHGVTPHFAAAIDPDPPLDRFDPNVLKAGAFIYQHRVSHKLLQRVRAPLIWMEGNGNFSLEEWILKKVGLDVKNFNGGWNVSTFLTATAFEFGCNPIIFVGMNHASIGTQLYSKGVKENQRGEEWIEAINDAGEKVWTKRDWIAASQWISTFAQAQPDISWINCTERGLRIDNVKKISLEETLQQLINTYDLKTLMQNCQSSSHLSVQIFSKEIFKEIDHNLMHCSSICGRLIKELEKSYPNSPEQNREYLLLTIELEEQALYKEFLYPIWQVWERILIRQIPKEIPEAFGIILNKFLFLKGLCDEARQI